MHNMIEDSFHLGIKALILDFRGKILLLQVNPEAIRGENIKYWDIPGGRIAKGDTIEDTLKREIEEETGITHIQKMESFSWTLSNIRIPVDDGDVGLILAVFEVDVENNPKIQLSNEHINYEWFTPQETADLLSVKYPKEFTNKIKIL